MSTPAMLVKRLRPEAALPVRGSSDAAGFDLSACEAAVVPKGSKAIVKTGLSLAVPKGTYARIAPRSGLAAKKMIDVGAGVVDSDYRGEVGVVLFNHGEEDFAVAAGDRIAQLVVEKINIAPVEEVETLDSTTRGTGGYGSTGTTSSPTPEVTASPGSPPRKKLRPEDQKLQVKKLKPEAVLPKRGSEEAAGYDLSAVDTVTVPAGGKAIVKTGLSIAIPESTYARIAPRSGLAAKHMIHTGAGVVDYDYRGEVGVVMFNYGSADFAVNAGDRVAQMILEQIDMVDCKEVDSLDSTERGSGGFGSTGVSNATAAASEEARTSSGVELLVKKLVPEALLPAKGSEFAAGFDLAAAQASTIPARGKAIVKTGISIATPRGSYARIAPRSGLAAKKMIHVGAGVVDADYRGEVGVVLFNHGPEAFEVAPGDRVAQLILEKIDMLPCQEVDSLDNTTRGEGGFGSTGVAAKTAPEVTAAAVAQPLGA